MDYKKMFYLVGKNKKNSFSPLLHNKLFELKGRKDYRYEIYEDGVLPKLKLLEGEESFGGLSISIPFKKSYAEDIRYSEGG